MDLFQRAILYIRRKRSKSLILFLILLVIATFVLTGFSIRRASETAALNLRQSLGGSFSLTIDKSKSDNFQPRKNGETGMVYIGEPISDKVVEQVMKTKGIDDLNAYRTGNALLKSKDSEYLHLVKTNDRYQDDEIAQHTITSEADTQSAYSSYFQKGILQLAEGEHLTIKDTNAALISQELAAQNKLKIGDEIQLALSGTVGGSAVVLKISGIFEIVEPQLNTGVLPPTSLYQNRIFTDIQSGNMLYSKGSSNYNRADFYVNDPAQIDSIIQKVREDKSINWSCFAIDANDVEYQRAAKPLESIDTLISTLLLVMIMAGTAVLSMILTMWMKSRIHETGVFLSIGISKAKIVLQHIAEILIIAAFAFGISFFTSGAVAQTVGSAMLQSSSERKASSTLADLRDETPQAQNNETTITELIVQVSLSDLAWVYGMGALVVIASVGLSSIPVLRLKPKEILTRMS